MKLFQLCRRCWLESLVNSVNFEQTFNDLYANFTHFTAILQRTLSYVANQLERPSYSFDCVGIAISTKLLLSPLGEPSFLDMTTRFHLILQVQWAGSPLASSTAGARRQCSKEISVWAPVHQHQSTSSPTSWHRPRTSRIDDSSRMSFWSCGFSSSSSLGMVGYDMG